MTIAIDKRGATNYNERPMLTGNVSINTCS